MIAATRVADKFFTSILGILVAGVKHHSQHRNAGAQFHLVIDHLFDGLNQSDLVGKCFNNGHVP
jgi:hypothetical protein